MVDSFHLLINTINEKDEEFTRRKLNKFCNMLSDSRRSEEVELFSIVFLLKLFLMNLDCSIRHL